MVHGRTPVTHAINILRIISMEDHQAEVREARLTSMLVFISVVCHEPRKTAGKRDEYA
jgi:hypothetical protein